MNSTKALLIDLTMCIGCNSCQVACKKEYGLSDGEEKHLSASAFTALDEFDGTYVRRLCQHCLTPTCVSVCPVGAFTKSPEGPVLYDENKCIGCRYCMQACPFQVPRYEWGSTHPRVQKCKFCEPRLAKGLQPACSEICPTGATKFGDRDALIKEAHARIAAEPTKYIDKVYGLEEVGGTSVFYISGIPFENLGFNTKLQKAPMSLLTWNALEKVPSVFMVGGVLLYGIWWITKRRKEVEAYEADMERKGNQ